MLNALIYLLIQTGEEGAPIAGSTEGSQSSPWSSLIMIVALIAIFYFLMIRPQQKKQKEIKKFRENIKVGDSVITAGGIHGKVTAIKEETFTIAIAHEVHIKVDKGSVYPIGTPGQGAPIQEKA